jgi:hypothetical protein
MGLSAVLTPETPGVLLSTLMAVLYGLARLLSSPPALIPVTFARYVDNMTAMRMKCPRFSRDCQGLLFKLQLP